MNLKLLICALALAAVLLLDAGAPSPSDRGETDYVKWFDHYLNDWTDFNYIYGSDAFEGAVFTANPGMALWFLLFIVVLQTISGNTIYPRLLGSSVGIPSLWVLAAITIGGGIGGIGGMLVSVPVTATLYALIHEWVRKKNGAPAD